MTARVCAAVAALSRSGNWSFMPLLIRRVRGAPLSVQKNFSSASARAPGEPAESAAPIDWPSSTSLLPPPLQRVAQSPQLAVADERASSLVTDVFGGVRAHLERLPQRDFQHAQPIGRIAAFEAHHLLDPRSQAKRATQQLVETLLGGVADRGRRAPSFGGDASLRVASASTASIASRCSVLAVGSSRMVKPGATSASSGKRCKRRSQNEWMVCTLSPPGVSMAVVNRVRARSISAGVGLRAVSSASDVCELCLVHGHPLRQRVVDALRHLGRSGLGVGKGEDALGYRAGQHKAQRAQREHVRLAGAGVGAHPGGRRRIGRVALGLVRAFEVGSVRRHGSTSSSSATAHSATRARCA